MSLKRVADGFLFGIVQSLSPPSAPAACAVSGDDVPR
jgi:hypothetical protein